MSQAKWVFAAGTIKDSLYRILLYKLAVHCFPADLTSVLGCVAKSSCRSLAHQDLM